ncbi:MAG: FAD-dependent oxidoreductase [Spirochaetales bacterium]|nr:FAD-dependent oxidoreductase [Spirochaetales bacterium]
MSERVDFAIAGAGPAGLAAAITAAGRGHSVTVVEKGPIAGPEPRGESMPQRPVVDRLLGPGFLEGIMTFMSLTREFHSPMDRKSSVVRIKEPYYFFEWRDLIDALVDKAESLGVKFIYNAEVTGVSIEDGSGQADGLIYMKDGAEGVLRAGVVFGCGGRSCPVATHYGIDTEAIACPTVKFRGKNAPLAECGKNDLQFYTVPPDSFKSVQGFPPAFAYIFPVGKDRIEAGLMLRLSQVEKLDNVRMPSGDDIMKVWEEAKNSLPGFSAFFKGTETEYQQLTSIQNRMLITENIMGSGGAVLAGDSTGLVDANGSAGLCYALAQAEAWANMLSKKMSAPDAGDLWSGDNIREYYKQQSGWDFYRYIRKSFGTISIFERLLFKTFGSVKKINRAWPFIVFLLRRAS